MNTTPVIAKNDQYVAVSPVDAMEALQAQLAALQKDLEYTNSSCRNTIVSQNNNLEPLEFKLEKIHTAMAKILLRRNSLGSAVLMVAQKGSGVPSIETMTPEARQSLEETLDIQEAELQKEKDLLLPNIEQIQQALMEIFGKTPEEIRLAKSQIVKLEPQLTKDDFRELERRRIEKKLLEKYEGLYAERLTKLQKAQQECYSQDERTQRRAQ